MEKCWQNTDRPKNDDELELEVGDKIEVIGIEEEGWWKGKLKGRVGVFPSNFVQVIESGPPSTKPNTYVPSTTTTAPTTVSSLFGSKLSKTSLSSNSLNNNSNGTNNSNNNNNNNNLNMNNTQNPDGSGISCADESTVNSSERRPKPIRGVGYGDIFASGGIKPSQVDSTSLLARERLSASIKSILQKQIPRKPPPPAPTSVEGDGSSTDEAPKLPPKPTPGTNQFNSLMQSPLPALPSKQQQQSSQKPREQARVIYEYEPMNEDELAMKPGDIIDILDKEIEDVGWWKGELNGKIGVFPDNFVQLLEMPDVLAEQSWHDRVSMNSSHTASTNSSHNTEGKIKSVFAATPKGFSKELENNLEKHSSPASFLSLKRTKLQQQIGTGTGALTGESTMTSTMDNDKNRGDSMSSLETTITKLNHITANRAKGPTRRPPSSILSKRNQLDQGKRESNGRDDLSLGSLPIDTTTQSTTHDLLSSLPASQHVNPTSGIFSSKPSDGNALNPIKPSLSLDNVIDNLPSTPKTSQRANITCVASDKSKPVDTPPWMVQLKKVHGQKKRDSPTVNVSPLKDEAPTVKPSDITNSTASSENGQSTIPQLSIPIGEKKQPINPHFSTQVTEKKQPTIAPLSTPTVEKKHLISSQATTPVVERKQPTITPSSTPTVEKKQLTNSQLTSSVGEKKQSTIPPLSTPVVEKKHITNSQYSTPVVELKQPAITQLSTPSVERDVNSEISELREEIKRLKEDFHGLSELKTVVEVMSIELKACQSATENQRRYIKELVNNLADERKKIASMQVEIDRNLK